MTLNNSLLAKVELKRDRNLSYNFTDNRLQETSGNEVIVGSGYKLKNVRFPFAVGNKKINNDLNLRADLSIRFTRTVARGAVDGINQITNGQRIVSLNTSADYMVTQRVNVRFFFDTIITRPLISTSFPSSNLKGGLSIRFTLS
jgi:cell surface protein SprA